MKFRAALILALCVTSFILATNANQSLFFEKANGSRGNITESNSYLRSLSAQTLVGPQRFSKAVAISVSSTRADAILRSSLPKAACVEAYQVTKGTFDSQPVISLNPSQKLIPASTNKLITATVVLSTLDPSSTLDTSLLAVKKSVTLSKAYVRTSGDPSFVASTTPTTRRPDYLSPTHIHTFDDFAAKTFAAGVRSISNLVVDNTWFGLDSVEPGWSADKAQVGLLAALNADEGFDGASLATNANDHATALLKASFAAQGISIGNITYGAIPDSLGDSSVIAKTSSATIKDLVSDTLKASDNVYAEQLLAAATHAKVGNVTQLTRANFVAKALSDLGVDTSGYDFVNGSGYSKNAHATCELENAVVQLMDKKGINLPELSSHAGHDGTLAKRFTDLNVNLDAKTGTLDGVTALTGELDDKLAFSFIANGSFTDDGGKALQGQVVSTLTSFPFVPPPKFPFSFAKHR